MPINATTNVMDSMSTTQGGWGITAIIFVTVLIMVFLLSKNFRQFVYGAVISGVLLLNYMFSRYVGVATTQNNFKPLKNVCFVFGFIVISIIIGILVQKLKFVKNLEKKISEATKEAKE